MKFRMTLAAAAGLIAPLAASTLLPTQAHADPWYRQAQHQQQNKNTWRNLGIVAAAASVYGFVSHNTTVGVLGAAGAAYSADRYEQERHAQSVEQNGWGYRDGGRGYEGAYNQPVNYGGRPFNGYYTNAYNHYGGYGNASRWDQRGQSYCR